MKNMDGETVICDKIDGVTVILNLVHFPFIAFKTQINCTFWIAYSIKSYLGYIFSRAENDENFDFYCTIFLKVNMSQQMG